MKARPCSDRSEHHDRVLAVVQENAASLLRLAARFSLCADDAQDAYQRALLIYLERIERVDPATAGAWLRTIDDVELTRTRLVVRGYVRPGASGTLRATFTGRVRGRKREASRVLTVRGRFFTLRLTIPRSLRGVRRGRLVLAYSGDDVYLPARLARTARR